MVLKYYDILQAWSFIGRESQNETYCVIGIIPKKSIWVVLKLIGRRSGARRSLVYIMPCMLLLWCRGCSRPDGATSVILCSYRTPCNYICSYCIHVHIPKLGLYLDTVTLVPASPRDCLPPRLSFDRRLGRRAGLCTCYLWRALKAVFQDIPGVILRTSEGRLDPTYYTLSLSTISSSIFTSCVVLVRTRASGRPGLKLVSKH